MGTTERIVDSFVEYLKDGNYISKDVTKHAFSMRNMKNVYNLLFKLEQRELNTDSNASPLPVMGFKEVETFMRQNGYLQVTGSEMRFPKHGLGASLMTSVPAQIVRSNPANPAINGSAPTANGSALESVGRPKAWPAFGIDQRRMPIKGTKIKLGDNLSLMCVDMGTAGLKLSVLSQLIASTAPALILVLRTNLNGAVPVADIELPGYNLFRQDVTTSSGGGLLVYYHRQMRVSVIRELEDTDFEAIWVKMAETIVDQEGEKKEHVTIVGNINNHIRTPGTARSTAFTDYIHKCLTTMSHIPHDELYIQGDFNLRNPEWLEPAKGDSTTATAEGVCLQALALKNNLNVKSDGNAKLVLYRGNKEEVHVTFDENSNATTLIRHNCAICREVFVEADDMIRHRQGTKHRRNFCFYMYQKNRSDLIQDKFGMTLQVAPNTENVRYDETNGVIEIVTEPGVRAKVNLIMKNSNPVEATVKDDSGNPLGVIIKAIDFLRADPTFHIDDKYSLSKAPNMGRDAKAKSGIRLPNGRQYQVTISAQNSHRGQYKIPLVFQLKSDLTEGPDQLQHMAREIHLKVETPDMSEIGPTAPYQKPKPVTSNWHVTGKPVEGLRPDAPPQDANELKMNRSLDHYMMSPTVQKILNRGFVSFTGMTRDERTVYDVAKRSLDRGLRAENYVERFKFLLHCEEHQMQYDIRHYDMEGVSMTESRTNHRLLELSVPGLAENRPSVLRGDRLYVRIRHGPNKVEDNEYEGIVHDVQETKVILGFAMKLKNKFVRKMQFDVRFTFNRFPLRNMHRAVELVKKLNLQQKVVPVNSAPTSTILKPIKMYNKLLENNKEQISAVQHIVSGSSGTSPYIVFGPPGTGKTVTMVEAIVQVFHNVPSSQLLVTAPSNSAADLLASRLKKYIPKTQKILRIHAPSRLLSRIPSDILDISNHRMIAGQSNYYYPSIDKLLKFRILVVTLVTAGRIVSADFPPNHFTHVFVDEAGHAMEPETVIPVACLSSQGQLVLAGDPKQLGPILRSPIALKFGLDVSLLERIMEEDEYQMYKKAPSYDARYITKLLQNFRSHPSLLTLPSKLFYENELVPAADKLITESCLQWPALTNNKVPLLFHGVIGQDEQESKSPSFFNAAEVCTVADYVEDLLSCRKLAIKPKDIGIISPYRRQVQKIRELLMKNLFQKRKPPINDWKDISVGSTEEFQGQERRVIIISTVRSQPDFIGLDYQHKLGFLKNPKRFNVAVTRAKALLIVVGNPKLLSIDPNWREFIAYARAENCYTGVQVAEDEDGMDDVTSKFHMLGLNEKWEEIRQDDISAREHYEGQEWRTEQQM